MQIKIIVFLVVIVIIAVAFVLVSDIGSIVFLLANKLLKTTHFVEQLAFL